MPLDLQVATRLIEEPIIPELLDPVVDAAARDLDDLVDLHEWRVAPEVIADIVGWFRQTLARMTNLVVLQRFTGFHLVLDPFWRPPAAPPGDAPEGAPRGILDSYIAWEEIERLLSDDGPYPELGRVLRLARANWLAAVGELIERVDRHRNAIARLAGCAAGSLGALSGVRFGISDPHGGGRTAAVLTFGEWKVVYKPRSLDAEIGWTAVVDRVLRESLELEAYQLQIAGFDGYGFMEFVEATPCSSVEEVRRCYRRYGGLLAAAHALGTCDLHHENVIVSGEHPVVVDAEPLCRARLAISAQGEARLKFERNLSLEGLEVRESILELGILPMVMRPPLPPDEGEVRAEIEIGALCAYAHEPVRDLLPCARGSDDLQVRYVPVSATRFPNLPAFNDQPQLPAEFLDEIVAGFESAHRFLDAHRQEYVEPGGLLEALASSRVRLLVHPTMNYTTVLVRSLSPEPLRSFAARSRLIASDLQVLDALRFDSVQDLAPLEAASLLAGDIPRFELNADRAVCDGVSLLAPPLDSAKTRWSALDDLDRELQIVSIRERLLHREKGVAATAPHSTDRSDLERHALEIVSSLVDAVRSPDADPFWVYACFAPGFGATMAHADRESLYEGAAGTALVVAEAGRLAGERTWCRLAARVFDPIVRGGTPVSVRRSGGVGRGLGGLIYAMARVADATGEEALLDAAVRVATEHGPRLARDDGLNEVLYGRAGLLLGLLALHDRRPDARLLAVADLAARQLLGRAVRKERGKCWPVPAGSPMPNVSHGTAGIAMALARWARVRDAAEAAEAAEDALLYDDAFWLAEERGWIDARLVGTAPERRTTWSWCNGRSGALLARLAVAHALERPFRAGLVPSALEADATDAVVENSPGLCCGTPGIVDALLHVQEHADGSNLEELVVGAVDLLATKSPPGHYATLTSSLFAGTAGLAFALLRAARPAEVASVLWFR